MKNPVDIFTKRWRRKQEDPTLYPDLEVEPKHVFTYKKLATPKSWYTKRGTLHVQMSKERRQRNRARARARMMSGRRRLPHGRARGTK